MSENIIEKIKKLLALSHSSNEHEAASALAQAMKMARKHDIDLEQVKGTEFDEKIDEEDAIYKAQFSKWERYLFDGIAREFGCRILLGSKVDYDTHKIKRRIIMVGKKQDRQMAVYLAMYLHRTVKKLYKAKKEELNYIYGNAFTSQHRIREDYCYGCVYSILKTATEMFRKAADNTEAGNGLIIKKGYAVDRYIDEMGIKDAKTRSTKNCAAIFQGVIDGKDVSINRPLEQSGCPIKQIM